MNLGKFEMKLIPVLRKLVFAISLTLLVALPLASVQAQSTEATYAIVELSAPGAVRYLGGINGLPATAAAGRRFDPESPAYAAYRKHLENEQANFRAALGKRAPQAQVVGSFTATANAVVVELNGLSLGQLKQLGGAKEVYESGLYYQDMDRSVELINAPAAWAQVGGREGAGEGVRIGVIDSGNVNSLIPGFQPFFNCKEVEFGGVFYSGETALPAIGIRNPNADGPPNMQPFIYVSDHGTHVAGTAGGCVITLEDGTVISGVAPGATLIDYNVFPGWGAGVVAFEASAFSHDIADAIETSVLNGDHVINMSLGGRPQGPNDFLAQVSNAAVAAGVVVVTSAGNAGPGLETIGSPGSGSDVIAVGATTNSRGLGVLVDVDGFPTMVGVAAADFAAFDGNPETLIDYPGSDNLACTVGDAPAGSASGHVVLIERGGCTFSEKACNAIAAGADGFLVFTDNRAPTAMAATAGICANDTALRGVMIARQDGLDIEAALAVTSPLGATISGPTSVPTTPNELAGFSSRGLNDYTAIVKPNLVAPGVNILSSEFFGFGLKNGTSMASPHVAGAAAVLLGENPGWTPAQVRSALTTTTTNLGLAPWMQGSGLLDLERALNANAFFSPTDASFGSFTGKASTSGSIDIHIDTSATCNVSGTSGPFISAVVSGDTLTVDFDGGRDAPSGFHGGYVFVDCDGQNHTIPWAIKINRGNQ